MRYLTRDDFIISFMKRAILAIIYFKLATVARAVSVEDNPVSFGICYSLFLHSLVQLAILLFRVQVSSCDSTDRIGSAAYT